MQEARIVQLVYQLGYGLNEQGVRVQFPERVRELPLLHNVQARSGAHLHPIQWVPGPVSPGIKQQGCEADHSPPSSAKVNDGAIPPLSHTSSWRSA
jgi:hypothetical protein